MNLKIIVFFAIFSYSIVTFSGQNNSTDFSKIKNYHKIFLTPIVSPFFWENYELKKKKAILKLNAKKIKPTTSSMPYVSKNSLSTIHHNMPHISTVVVDNKIMHKCLLKGVNGEKNIVVWVPNE